MYSIDRPPLPEALRVMLITDDRGDVARIEGLVRSALEGGIRAFQIRERALSVRQIARLCESLRPACDALDALLLVNTHAEVAAAELAHGVHLNARSVTPAHARRFLDRSVVVGYSAHDPQELDEAADGGADYATLSPVFPTTCKPGADPLGPVRAVEWTARARLPVVWLGGVDAQRVGALGANPPFGVAVMSAICDADDVASAARVLMAASRRVLLAGS